MSDLVSDPPARPLKTKTCPICGKPCAPKHDPFCSRRCADVDLGRWLKGVYVIPGAERLSEQEQD